MIFEPNLILNVVEPGASYGKPGPLTTHYVGPVNHSLRTFVANSVFVAHYPHFDEPFMGPVKKLTFTQVGSSEAPNLNMYANDCETVEFTGYVNTPSTIVDIVGQLPKVSSVDIFIGAAEQHAMLKPCSKYFTKTQLCPNVKSLEIIMDLDYFHHFGHDCNGDESQCINPKKCPIKVQNYLVRYVKSLLKCARNSFPNLINLGVNLPENHTLCKAVQSLIKVCDGLKDTTEPILEDVEPTDATSELCPLDSGEALGDSSWFIPSTLSPILPLPRQLPLGPMNSSDYEFVNSEENAMSLSSDVYPGNSASLYDECLHPDVTTSPEPTTTELSHPESCLGTLLQDLKIIDVEERVRDWVKTVWN